MACQHVRVRDCTLALVISPLVEEHDLSLPGNNP